MTGFTRKLTTLDDRELALTLPVGLPITYDQELKTLPGEGMPIWRCPQGRKGNLIITFMIDFPPPQFYMNPLNTQALAMVLPPKPEQIGLYRLLYINNYHYSRSNWQKTSCTSTV